MRVVLTYAMMKTMELCERRERKQRRRRSFCPITLSHLNSCHAVTRAEEKRPYNYPKVNPCTIEQYNSG